LPKQTPNHYNGKYLIIPCFKWKIFYLLPEIAHYNGKYFAHSFTGSNPFFQRSGSERTDIKTGKVRKAQENCPTYLYFKPGGYSREHYPEEYLFHFG
jgi:hypothetical protein